MAASPAQTVDDRHRSETTALRPWTLADWLTAGVAVLVVVASTLGLWIPRLYTDGDAVEAMFRGYDLVALVFVAPALALTLVPAIRRQAVGVLLRIGMLTYCVYNYAYYLFGAELNAALLTHVAIFTASLYALVISLIAVDAVALASRWWSRTPARTVALILGLLGVALAALQLSGLLRFALTGVVLDEPSRLVVPATFTRLGAVLDLSLLVPVYLLAAVWLWRRRPWGYLLASTVLLAGTLHQVAYISGMLFQIGADVPEAGFDPFEPFILALYAVGTVLLLAGSRSRGPHVPRHADQRVPVRVRR